MTIEVSVIYVHGAHDGGTKFYDVAQVVIKNGTKRKIMLFKHYGANTSAGTVLSDDAYDDLGLRKVVSEKQRRGYHFDTSKEASFVLGSDFEQLSQIDQAVFLSTKIRALPNIKHKLIVETVNFVQSAHKKLGGMSGVSSATSAKETLPQIERHESWGSW